MRRWMGFVVLVLGVAFWLQAGAQETTPLAISITAPPDGYVTVSSKIEVRGIVSTMAVALPRWVIVSVNGEARKVELRGSGFSTQVALELGENLISVIAVGANDNLASARAYVTRQNPVLFFDDFEGDQPNPTWGATSGTWVIQEGVYTIAQHGWSEDAFTYVVTPESSSWQNYAVETDVLSADDRGHYSQSSAGIVLRAVDDLNKVVFQFHNDRWVCWRVVKRGKWSDCMSKAEPGLSGNVRLRIEVSGDTYTAYVNGVERTSMKETTFTKGMPGLLIYASRYVSFDNFKVESLAAGSAETTSMVTIPQPTESTQEVMEKEMSVTTAAETSPELTNIKERVGLVEQAVATLRAQVAQNRNGITTVESRLADLDQNVKSLGSSIGNLVAEQHEMLANLQSVTTRVGELEQRKAVVAPDVEARIESIEEGLNSVNQRVTLSIQATDKNLNKLETLSGEFRGARRSAWLGLMAGIGGAALALVVGLLTLT